MRTTPCGLEMRAWGLDAGVFRLFCIRILFKKYKHSSRLSRSPRVYITAPWQCLGVLPSSASSVASTAATIARHHVCTPRPPPTITMVVPSIRSTRRRETRRFHALDRLTLFRPLIKHRVYTSVSVSPSLHASLKFAQYIPYCLSVTVTHL